MERRSPVTLIHVTTVPFTLWAFFRGQATFMRRHGMVVHAVSAPGALLETFAVSEGVAVHAVPMARRVAPVSDLAALVRMISLLRRLRPDIVHAHTPKGGLLGMIGAWVTRVPVRIYHIHGLPYTTSASRRRRILKLSEVIACRCAHRVLCVSQSIREVAIAEGICTSAKIAVPASGSISGVDAEQRFNPLRFGAGTRAQLRQELGITPSDLVIGFVGRIVRDKGIVELASAWRSLSAETNNLHLVLVGPIEPDDAVPADILAELRGDPRVHLVPQVDDTSPFYAAMDIVVLPSYREGFPVVPLEAAAMSLPVVATRVPGCIDAVEDGRTGTIIPPRDVNALRTALKTYLDDPMLRDHHGKAGRARVLSEFRPEVVWSAIHDHYRDLLARRRIER